MTTNKKKFWAIISIASIVFGLLIVKAVFKTNSDRTAEQKIKLLPPMPFQFLHGKGDKFTNAVIVIFFSPDCEHCQRTAEQLSEIKDRLVSVEIIMVTQANSKQAEDFYQRYKLYKINNLQIAIDQKFEFYKFFGHANVPTVYVYDDRHILLKKIQGEANITRLIELVK